MEKGDNKGNRQTSRRLVISCLVIIIFALSGCGYFNLNPGPGPELDSFRVKSAAAVMISRAGYLYQQPLIYLLLLPGPVCLLVVIILKKRRISGVLLILSFLLLFAPVRSLDDTAKHLEEGIKLYITGSHEQALQNFLDVADMWKPNSALQYNIALCYYKLAEPGMAVYALKKAININCTDQTINGFLEKIQEKYQLNSQVNTNPYFHPDLPFVIMLVFFNLSCILLAVILKIGKGQLVILFVCSAVIMLLALGVFISGQIHTGQRIGVIVGGLAPVKQIPDEMAKERIQVKEGTIVKVLWEFDDNIFIQTGRGFKGWVGKANILKDW